MAPLNPAKGGGAYSGLFPIPATENEYLGKFDQNLGDKDHVAATYFYSKNVLGNSPGGNIPWTINNNVSAGTNINLSDVHTFSPTTANQTWLTFTRAAGGRVNLPVTWPGVADPRIVRLELSHPGTALVAHHLRDQFLSDRDQRRSVHGFRQL